MKINLLTILCSVALVLISGSSAPEIKQYLANSKASQVVLETSPATAAEKAYSWAGGSNGNATAIVRSVVVTKAGKRAFIRRSVYADLSNPNSVTAIDLSNGQTKIVISGGDAGDGYKCVFLVKRGEVVSRRLSDGEFPKNFYEETKYVSIPVLD